MKSKKRYNMKSKKKISRYRQLELITNADAMDKSRILAVIRKHKTVYEFVIVFHDQDTDKDGNKVVAHYHVYLRFTTPWAIDAVAKWFGISPNMVSTIKADSDGKNPARGKYYTLQYYTHSGRPDKHYYAPESFTANFDVAAYLAQMATRFSGKGSKRSGRAELDDILDRCASGEINENNYYLHIPPQLYARNTNSIKNAFAVYRDRERDNRNGARSCTTVWIYGESGTGKTSLGRLFAEQLDKSAYITAPGNDPLDGYRQQPVIILDELRPNDSFSFQALLQFLDPYNLAGVHSRYHDKYPNADYIIVCTVYSPDDYYSACTPSLNSDVDTRTQLYRRINEVWHVSRQTINISKYDADSGRFVDDETVDNPIPQYVARQSAEARLQTSPKSVLKGLVNTYVSPVSPPQSDDCPAVEAPFMGSAPKEDANESK